MFISLSSIAIILILTSTPAGLLIESNAGNIGSGRAYALSPNAIYRTASGLVASDSLTTGNSSAWGFNGSAVSLNAPRSGTEDSTGMHIGVLAPSTGTWAGYFAITPLLPAHLYHAKISLPATRPTDGGTYNVAVYVQQEMSQDPRIDAMGCGADVFATTTTWTLSLQAGDKDHEIVNQHVYDDNSPNQPLTRECTLVTNGDNQLTAYLDGVKVFSSNQMNLNMPQPFQYYLETQTNSASPSNGQSMFVGTFTDYYATTSDSIKIRDAGPTGSIVKIVDATSGKVIATGTSDSSGTAFVNVANYHMPINANVQLFDSSGTNLVSSTPSPLADIYGGDVFDVGTSISSSVQVTVNAVSITSGSPLSLYTTVSGGSGNAVPPGFSPYTFTVAEDGTYFVSVANYQNNVFDHWDDGTRFSSRIITPTSTSPLNLTAYFTDSSVSPVAPPSSLTSLSQYTTNVKSPTIIGTGTPGASIQIYDGQTQIATTPPSGSNSWSDALPALAEGHHIISATQSISSSGGSSFSPFSTPITMTIDSTPPSVAITSAKILQDGRAILAGTASDSGTYPSGLKSIQIGTGNPPGAFVSATPNQPGDWSAWTFITSQPLSSGSYHFIALASDLATNQASNSVDLFVPPPPGSSIIAVSSIDNFGYTITGMYTLLNQNGSTLTTGFTPISFTAVNGNYTVAVADYSTNLFDHWQTSAGNVYMRSIPVSVNNSVLALTAVYKHPLTAPSIGASPNALVQGQSSSLTSSAMATGVPPITYQWLQKGPTDSSFTPINGATSANYTFATTSSTAPGSWSFELQVTDSSGATATTAVPASINVSSPSTGTTRLALTCISPIDLGGVSSCTAAVSSTVGSIAGEQVSFTQAAGGTGSLAFNGGNSCNLMSNGTCTLSGLTGTSSGSVTIQASYPGDYSNTLSANTTAINVNAVVLAGAITPSNSKIDNGQSVLLTANPSGGTGSYSYQWYKGSNTCTTNLIAGATLPSYTPSPTASTSYNYRVTDSLSQTACSPSATVTVNPPLGAPTATPSATTIKIGQSITVQVAWKGGTPSYAARLYSSSSNVCNSGSILVASQSALQVSPAKFTSLSPSSTTYYCATITDSASTNSTTLSAPVLVTVKPTDSSSLTLTIGNVAWGNTVTLTGKLMDTTANKPISGATVSFTTSSGTKLPLNAMTNSIGVYKVNGTSPNAVGTWQITAHYAGDSVHNPVNTTASYSTTKHRVQLTLSVVPATVMHGQTYNVTGTLIDLSANNSPVAGATITFTATNPIKIASASTDSNGKFLVAGLIAPAAGSYGIQAFYAANTLYNSASSLKQTLTVT